MNVRLGFKFFNVIFICFGIDEPINIGRIIANGVFPVFTKFYGKTLKRAGMHALKKASDDKLGP